MPDSLLTLDRQLQGPMEPGRFLRISVSLARALGEIHRKGVIHKDIKPSNIFFRAADSDEIEIRGSGISACSPETAPFQGFGPVEGTLAYMSPEQTGRMNRALDHRTDLYSLGITFYQMLTGRLPFHANDPMEWVHCHIARTPQPPTALVPSLPPVVSEIVMKLIMKIADERYQNCDGLLHDLEQCVEQWESSHTIQRFELGRKDFSERFRIPQRLYGREEEISILLHAFERVAANGVPELFLISGYSGIGKSSLVRELFKPIFNRHGNLITGKFDQYQRDIPYSAMIQAIRGLVKQLLTESQEKIDSWRRKIESAVGMNGKVICDVIPEIRWIIGNPAPVPSLGPAESRNRFNLVFQEFIRAFTDPRRPLVLFLDDMQWADQATLELLQLLASASSLQNICFILAYRDNEVDPSHPLAIAIERLRSSGTPINHFRLGPLTRADLRHLLADTLHCSTRKLESLSDLVFRKTQGNPFFVSAFLQRLLHEGLLRFDRAQNAWDFDPERIDEKGFTDNIIELMIGQMRTLHESAQRALQFAACVGNTFDLETVSWVLERSSSQTVTDLWPAAEAGLVSPHLQPHAATYSFRHDKIQQAAYAMIPREELNPAHLKIGRRLLQHASLASKEFLHEKLFDIASHLNLSSELITDSSERESLARINLQAGKKAKSATAYAEAQNFLASGTALLAEDSWKNRYELTFSLHLEYSECAYLSGDFQNAEELFALLIRNARTDLERANVYNLQLKLCQVAGRYDEGVTLGFEALRSLGVDTPETDEEMQAEIDTELRAVKTHLRGRRIEDLLHSSILQDGPGAQIRAIISLMANSCPCAYIGRPKAMAWFLLKSVNLSLIHGNSEESCFSYGAYGLLLAHLGEIEDGYQFSNLALKLNDRLKDVKRRGMLLHLHADHLNFWKNHFATGLPILENAFSACLEVGDLVYASYLAFETVWQLFEKGESLDSVANRSRRFAAFARQTRNLAVYETIRMEQQFVASLKGLTRAPASLSDDHFEESASKAVIDQASFGCGTVFYHILKQILFFTYGRYKDALESAAEASRYLGAAMAMPIEATFHFYHALTCVALYPKESAERQKQFREILDQALGKYRLWSDHCPRNFQNRFALLSAEVARIEGRTSDAMRSYEQAIQASRDNGFPQYEALGFELAAKFYRESGFPTIARAYFAEARLRYASWGADGKVRDLIQEYPDLSIQSQPSPKQTFVTYPEQFDLSTVIKASQSISSNIQLSSLITSLMRILIEQAGAERGYLLLNRDQHCAIVAEATTKNEEVIVRLLSSVEPSSHILPKSILNFVQRTQERVLLDDSLQEHLFASDEYILQRNPKSILCVPILKQARLIGILYLENNLVSAAFTKEKLALLELLSSQAAISLENAVLYEEAQTAIRVREDFLAIASHELKTPLTPLKLKIQALAKIAQSDELVSALPRELRARLEKALISSDGEIDRLVRLADNLLDVSQIRAGKFSLRLEKFELGALVHQVVERHRFEVEAAGGSIELRIDENLRGNWDPFRIEQVITNLLTNAIRYGKGKPIRLHAFKIFECAILEVQDHGIGIARENQEKIFERFERATSVWNWGGMGLGLYITRQILELHRGSIEVDSEIDVGSTFRVSLPLEGDEFLPVI